MDPHVVYYLHIYNKYVVLMTDKPRLFMVVIFLHCILRQQYGQTLCLCHSRTQRCMKFIDIHNTAILFIASKPYLFDIGQCLISFVIIFNYFVWSQHSVFDIATVTCECTVLNLRTLWSRLCHQY